MVLYYINSNIHFAFVLSLENSWQSPSLPPSLNRQHEDRDYVRAGGWHQLRLQCYSFEFGHRVMRSLHHVQDWSRLNFCKQKAVSRKTLTIGWLPLSHLLLLIPLFLYPFSFAWYFSVNVCSQIPHYTRPEQFNQQPHILAMLYTQFMWLRIILL